MLYPQKIAFSACGRSREGAWIEIFVTIYAMFVALGRSREGAWIEINVNSTIIASL